MSNCQQILRRIAVQVIENKHRNTCGRTCLVNLEGGNVQLYLEGSKENEKQLSAISVFFLVTFFRVGFYFFIRSLTLR